MRLVVGIFASQNRSKTSRPVVRATGLNLEAFVPYSDYKDDFVLDYNFCDYQKGTSN